jgi:hypothetical protein
MSLSNMSSDLDEDVVLPLEEFHDLGSPDAALLTTATVSSNSILLLLLIEQMVREDLS